MNATKRILLLDDDEANRRIITLKLRQMGGYSVDETSGVAEAELKAHEARAADAPYDYFLVDVSVGVQMGPELPKGGIDAIRRVRAILTQIKPIAYSAKVQEDVELEARQAGAYRFLKGDEVRSVLDETLASLDDLIQIEREVNDLIESGNPAFDIVQHLRGGVNLFDTYGVLWYANPWNKEFADLTVPAPCCWFVCHRFLHRLSFCPGCAVSECIDRGKPTRSRAFLPVRERIKALDLAATPYYSRRDPKRLIGAIESVRDVTAEWEEHPAGARVLDIIEFLSRFDVRKPVRGAEDQLTFKRITFDVVRFYSYVAAGGLLVGTSTSKEQEKDAFGAWHARIDEVPEEYLAAIREREPVAFQHAPCFESQWVRCTHWVVVPLGVSDPSREPVVGLVELGRREIPVGEGELEDLRPYWEYLAAAMGEAIQEANDARRARQTQALREFVELSDSQAKGEDDVIRLAGQCLEKVLRPLSWHFRMLDRKRMVLAIKRGQGLGSGLYYHVADSEIPLGKSPSGSAKAITERRDEWNFAADVTRIRQSITAHQFTRHDLDRLAEIRSFATLPLLPGGRVLGAFSVQFADNSLDLESNREFLVLLRQAVAEHLGRFRQQQETEAKLELFTELDTLLLEHELDDEEAALDKVVLKKVVRAALELTHSEAVYYVRQERGFTELIRDPDLAAGDVEALRDTFLRRPRGAGNHVDVSALGGRSPRRDREPPVAPRVGSATREPEGTMVALAAAPMLPAAQVTLMLGAELHGRLVACARLPGLFDATDGEFLETLCRKASSVMVGLRARRRDSLHNQALRNLGRISVEMARSQDENVCLRLLLLAATAGECLGFSRGAIFLWNDKSSTLEGACAVGALERTRAERVWAEIRDTTFADKLRHAFSGDEEEAGLSSAVRRLRLTLDGESGLRAALHEGHRLLRQADQQHVLLHPDLQGLLDEASYAVLPLSPAIEDGRREPIGCLIADRSWLSARYIQTDMLDLLGLITEEAALLIHNRRLDRERRETQAEQLIGRGLGHALQSRVGLVQAWLSILETELGGEHADLVGKIRDATQFLARAGHLFRKLRHAADRPVPRPVPLADVLGALVTLYNDPRIQLHCPREPVIVPGDGVALEDALDQVIQNARQFTPPASEDGKIVVRLTAESDLCTVEIQDNGPGINPSIRDRLFEPGARYPDDRLGLGLSLAKAVIEAHGGGIETLSDRQPGACFRITLPTQQGG